jgi:hypothetical protein
MNDKPRMVEITDLAEQEALQAAAGELGTPTLYQRMDTLRWWVDADELKAWRSTRTSNS